MITIFVLCFVLYYVIGKQHISGWCSANLFAVFLADTTILQNNDFVQIEYKLNDKKQFLGYFYP